VEKSRGIDFRMWGVFRREQSRAEQGRPTAWPASVAEVGVGCQGQVDLLYMIFEEKRIQQNLNINLELRTP